MNHGVLRRQERIDEEFDPEEINERLSSTSRRESERPSYALPTGKRDDVPHYVLPELMIKYWLQ